jgi:hypothetical protein
LSKSADGPRHSVNGLDVTLADNVIDTETGVRSGPMKSAMPPLKKLFSVIFMHPNHSLIREIGQNYPFSPSISVQDPVSSNNNKGPVATNGACQKWHILFLDIFQRNLAHP